MPNHLGALVRGRRVDTDVASTVEVRLVDHARIVALIAVQGDLATPSLESVKAAFARLDAATPAAAVKLAGAAPPAPWGRGVAVVLLAGDVAIVAASGAARCYRERAGRLAELPAGAHPIAPGDALLAASHASLRTDVAFFTTPIDPAADPDRRDTLDAALEAALAATPTLVGVAAARVA